MFFFKRCLEKQVAVNSNQLTPKIMSLSYVFQVLISLKTRACKNLQKRGLAVGNFPSNCWECRLLRSTILDTVRGIAVLPARVAVDLNEDDDMDQVPKNVLHESDVGWFFCDVKMVGCKADFC